MEEKILTNLSKRLLLFYLLLFVGCARSPRPYSRSEIENIAHIKLPSSYTSIRFGTERGIDFLAYLRFELPEEDLDDFIESLNLLKPLSSDVGEIASSNVILHKDMGVKWWQPDLLLDKKVSDKSEPGFSWDLLVGYTKDDRANNTITVYMFNFSL